MLIEGPPEADALVPLAADKDMRPPVALLAHVVDEPGHSAFWPLAEFSPEWVAIQWALEQGVPARFIDLPAAHTLAGRREGTDPDRDGPVSAPPTPRPRPQSPAPAARRRAGAGSRSRSLGRVRPRGSSQPLG